MIESKSTCPYCGEVIELLLDSEMIGETYVEDCQVCCRPMVIQLTEEMGEPVAIIKTENDV